MKWFDSWFLVSGLMLCLTFTFDIMLYQQSEIYELPFLSLVAVTIAVISWIRETLRETN
jgi:hypothetical protein